MPIPSFGQTFDAGGQYGQARQAHVSDYEASKIRGTRERNKAKGGGWLGGIIGTAIGLGGSLLGVPAPVSGLVGNLVGGAIGGGGGAGSVGANVAGQMGWGGGSAGTGASAVAPNALTQPTMDLTDYTSAEYDPYGFYNYPGPGGLAMG